MHYTYTMEYYLAIKKNKIMPFAATCTGLEIIILCEVDQKGRYSMIWLILLNLKYDTNIFAKQKQTHRHRE